MLKKITSFTLFILMVLNGAYVSQASTLPTIKDTTFSSNLVLAGDTFTIKAHIDSPTGGNTANMYFSAPYHSTRVVTLYRDDSIGYWVGTYQTTKDEHPGKWTLSSTKLTDDTGRYVNVVNQDPVTPSVFIESYNLPPNMPTVNEVSYLTTAITGTADPESIVTIYYGMELLGTATADLDGNYSVSIPAQKGRTVLMVYATNANGKESGGTKVLVESTPPVPTVNQDVSDQSETVTGTSLPGLTISIRTGVDDGLGTIGTEIGVGTVDANGNFAVKIPVQEASTILSIYAVDVDGIMSNPALVGVQDQTPPLPPTINEVTFDSTNVSGIAEPLSRITIGGDNGTIATTSADINGHYSVNISLQDPGSFIWATAMDQAGNVSKPQKTVVIYTAPPMVFDAVTDQSTQVIVYTELNATISVKVDSNEIGSTSTASGTMKEGEANGPFRTYGTYIVTFPKQKMGTILSITATDALGNIGTSTEITVGDGTPPAPPTVNEITDDSNAITGTAEQGSTITAIEYYTDSRGRTYPNRTYTGNTDKDGNYSISIGGEKAGTKISVFATDAAGNKGEATNVTVQHLPPPIPTVDQVNDQSITVSGTTEPYNTVYVQVPNGEVWDALSARADYLGHFSITIPVQKAGNVLHLYAADSVGAVSASKEIVVADITPPNAPMVNKVTSFSTHVTGKAEMGSAITVLSGTTVVAKGETDGYGNYSIDIPVQKPGTKLSVTATDSAGNTSKSTDTVIALPAPINVKAVSNSYNSVKLSWDAVGEASGYEIYRATSSSGPFTKIATNTSTTYLNTSLNTGTTYYYKVLAYKTGIPAASSGFSTMVSATPILAMATGVKAASSSFNSIKIFWAAVSGASGYEVYRATSNSGPYSLVGITASTSLTNTGLTTNRLYFYKIRAYRMVGKTKVYSNFSAVVAAKPVPSVPTNFKAARLNTTSVKLTWSSVSGASGYELYRSTTYPGTYSLLKSTTSTSYTNSRLVRGRIYYYKVRAYRTVGATKVYSGWTTVFYAKTY